MLSLGESDYFFRRCVVLIRAMRVGFAPQVVLCSKHIALLTPAAETLLALLLPYSWQGAYIPVLPSSLLDVIDVRVHVADALEQ